MKSERSGWASLSQANAGTSSSNLPKEVRAALHSPARLAAPVLCPCINLPGAPSVSSLNMLPGRAHLFCILSMFSISNYLCRFYSVETLSRLLGMRFCGNTVTAALNAVLLGLLETDLMAWCLLVAMKVHGWVGTPLLDTGCFLSSSLHYQSFCILVPLSLLPFPRSHRFPPSCLFLGHSVTCFSSLFKNDFIRFF